MQPASQPQAGTTLEIGLPWLTPEEILQFTQRWETLRPTPGGPRQFISALSSRDRLKVVCYGGQWVGLMHVLCDHLHYLTLGLLSGEHNHMYPLDLEHEVSGRLVLT